MDAKGKAEFINSIASGEELQCKNCGSRNKSDSKFCIHCGAELVEPSQKSQEEVFSRVETVTQTKSASYDESTSVFAQGLPEWSVEPPQVVVRRRK